MGATVGHLLTWGTNSFAADNACDIQLEAARQAEAERCKGDRAGEDRN